MPALPETVRQAWDQRKGPAVFATVSDDGNPNVIYVGAIEKIADDKIGIVDNYFDKTRANIEAGSRGAFLWMTDQGKAFQAKGRIEYATEGSDYDAMLEWANDKHPRKALAILHVEEVYSGAEKLL